MSRLIDADALREELIEDTLFDTYEDYSFVIGAIGLAPTIDAEPVVRCKDCKFYPDGKGTTKWTPCCDMVRPPNWYCADGERRKDDASGTD